MARTGRWTQKLYGDACPEKIKGRSLERPDTSGQIKNGQVRTAELRMQTAKPYCAVSEKTAGFDTPATIAVIVTVPETGGSVYVSLAIPSLPVDTGFAPNTP